MKKLSPIYKSISFIWSAKIHLTFLMRTELNELKTILLKKNENHKRKK